MSDTENRIASLLSLLLHRTILPTDDVTMDTDTEWDSVKHIEIIMTIEEELGVSFPAEEIPLLTSMHKLIVASGRLL